MSAPSRVFVATLMDMLVSLGDVRTRAMFGGVSFFADGLAFALIADDVFYVKVDDQNRPAHEALGLRPFRPFPDKPLVMQYYPVPEAALEDPDEMLRWAAPAVAAARRADLRKPRKRRRSV